MRALRSIAILIRVYLDLNDNPKHLGAEEEPWPGTSATADIKTGSGTDGIFY